MSGRVKTRIIKREEKKNGEKNTGRLPISRLSVEFTIVKVGKGETLITKQHKLQTPTENQPQTLKK